MMTTGVVTTTVDAIQTINRLITVLSLRAPHCRVGLLSVDGGRASQQIQCDPSPFVAVTKGQTKRHRTQRPSSQREGESPGL